MQKATGLLVLLTISFHQWQYSVLTLSCLTFQRAQARVMNSWHHTRSWRGWCVSVGTCLNEAWGVLLLDIIMLYIIRIKYVYTNILMSCSFLVCVKEVTWTLSPAWQVSRVFVYNMRHIFLITLLLLTACYADKWQPVRDVVNSYIKNRVTPSCVALVGDDTVCTTCITSW